MTAAIQPFPESALRAVLAGTVAAWARSGDAPSAGDEPRRCYVDAFAGAEWAFGTGVARGAGDEMRVTAALRALDERVTAVLVEEDPAHLQRLYAELEDAVGGERLRATRDLASLEPGEVSLLESPFAAAAGDVARFAAGGRAFVLLAPPAARALPWDALRPLAASAGATLLVRLPFSDFEKQSRHNSPVADLPGFARRIVEGCSAMLGDPKHNWLPAWRSAAADGISAAMLGVVERFGALLADTAPGRIVKPMVLETADGAAAWLFLVTADAAVATAANASVRAAGLKDRAAADDLIPAAIEPLPPVEAVSSPVELAAEPSADVVASEEPAAPKKAKKRSGRAVAPSPDSLRSSPPPPKPTGGGGSADESPSPAPAEPVVAPMPVKRAPPKPVVAEPLDLFGDEPPSLEPELPTLLDPAAVAEQIAAQFAGRTATWQEVLRAFAATDVTPAELKKALAVLRRGGRAVYQALKRDEDAIEFPAEPIAQPAKPKPPRRPKPSGDAGLFGDEP